MLRRRKERETGMNSKQGVLFGTLCWGGGDECLTLCTLVSPPPLSTQLLKGHLHFTTRLVELINGDPHTARADVYGEGLIQMVGPPSALMGSIMGGVDACTRNNCLRSMCNSPG